MPETKRKRRYGREEVKVITNEWVENNCVYVTPRDLEMLKLLGRFPILSSSQLYLLTPGAGGQKAFYEISQGQKRCNDRIRVLYDMHCVNKAAPKLPMGEGTSKQYVWIDRAGIKLLNQERRAKNELPQDYKHRSLITDVYCDFVLGQRTGQWDVRYLQTEQPCANKTIIPDLMAIIKFTGVPRGAVLAIEVDRSEKKDSVEKVKLQAYRQWELSRSWISEPFVAKLPSPLFPQIIYLFDEAQSRWKRRRNVLENEAKRINLNARFMGLSEFGSYLNSLK